MDHQLGVIESNGDHCRTVFALLPTQGYAPASHRKHHDQTSIEPCDTMLHRPHIHWQVLCSASSLPRTSHVWWQTPPCRHFLLECPQYGDTWCTLLHVLAASPTIDSVLGAQNGIRALAAFKDRGLTDSEQPLVICRPYTSPTVPISPPYSRFGREYLLSTTLHRVPLGSYTSPCMSSI